MMKHGILPYPWRPGPFRTCPKCGRAAALEQIAERKDAIAVIVVTYRCNHCGKEVESAMTRPPHCL